MTPNLIELIVQAVYKAIYTNPMTEETELSAKQLIRTALASIPEMSQVKQELKIGDPVFIKPFPVWDNAALQSIGKYGLIHSDDGQHSYWVTIYHGGSTLVPKSSCQPVLPTSISATEMPQAGDYKAALKTLLKEADNLTEHLAARIEQLEGDRKWVRPEIPQWIIDYKDRNYQSSAGRAVQKLVEIISDYDIHLNKIK